MKWLKFDTCSHYARSEYHALYAIDWQCEEQKYKEPLEGVRVYESGRIEVHKNGYRDPVWRRSFEQLLGMSFNSPKRGFPNHEFYTVDGEKIVKSQIKDLMVLHDSSRGRVYHVGQWSKESKITFYHPNAQPVNTKQITLRRDNRERFAAALETLKEHFALGDTLNGMGVELPRHYSYYLHWSIEGKLRNPPKDLTDNDVRHFCMNIAMFRDTAEKKLMYATQDVINHDYLIVKEK